MLCTEAPASRSYFLVPRLCLECSAQRLLPLLATFGHSSLQGARQPLLEIYPASGDVGLSGLCATSTFSPAISTPAGGIQLRSSVTDSAYNRTKPGGREAMM